MTKILSVLLTALTICLYGQIPTNGLVSSYPFTGNSNDASGNGNNLTPFNGPTPTTDRFGNPNCAYFFDGINDYFTAPSPGPLLQKSRSLAFWAKMSTNFNNDGYTVLSYGDPNNSGARFEVGLNSGCNGLYLDIGNGYGTATYSGSIDNTWHLYVVTYDSTTSNQLSTVKYYIDAVLTNSYCVQPWLQNINTINYLPINIGRFNPSLTRYFSGSLDDIHVYNRPLTQAEINSIFTYSPVGLSEVSLPISNLLVYPNPVSSKLSLTGLGNYSQIELCSAISQVLVSKSVKNDTEEINLEGFAPGIYFLRVTGSSVNTVKKVIKE